MPTVKEQQQRRERIAERLKQLREAARAAEEREGVATKTKKNDAMADMKRASAAVLIYRPGIEDSIQTAAFLGAAVLMEKRIILLAQNNVEIPEKLYFLADKVMRSDDPASLVSRIEDFTTDWGVTEDTPIVVNP